MLVQWQTRPRINFTPPSIFDSYRSPWHHYSTVLTKNLITCQYVSPDESSWQTWRGTVARGRKFRVINHQHLPHPSTRAHETTATDIQRIGTKMERITIEQVSRMFHWNLYSPLFLFRHERCDNSLSSSRETHSLEWQSSHETVSSILFKNKMQDAEWRLSCAGNSDEPS